MEYEMQTYTFTLDPLDHDFFLALIPDAYYTNNATDPYINRATGEVYSLETINKIIH